VKPRSGEGDSGEEEEKGKAETEVEKTENGEKRGVREERWTEPQKKKGKMEWGSYGDQENQGETKTERNKERQEELEGKASPGNKGEDVEGARVTESRGSRRQGACKERIFQSPY
jgi:hypothetical protein